MGLRPCSGLARTPTRSTLGYYSVVREIGETEGRQKAAICDLLVPSDGRDIVLILPQVPLAAL